MKWIMIVSLWLALGAVNAQETQLRQAFGRSYVLEKETRYKEAAAALMPVYDNEAYELNLRLGWLHYKAGQYTESLRYYDRSRKIRPMSIEAKLGYALPAAALEHWDQVLSTYLDILNIDPNETTALYQVGVIYYYRKDYDKADKYLGKLVNLYPFGYNGLLMLGWNRLQQGRMSEARVLFNKVLFYDPSDASALEGLSLIK